MDLGLKGKSVIVTGCGSNIGRAIVFAFTAEGCSITIAELSSAQGEKVRRSISGFRRRKLHHRADP